MKRSIFATAAMLAALVFGVPTASPDVGLQPVTVACSVGAPFTLGADPTTVTQLALAFAAMTDPTCGITQTDPTAAPDQHFAVGGGLTAEVTKFSFSAHQNTSGQVSGYAHISGPAAFGPDPADVQGHVNCLSISGNEALVGFHFDKGSIVGIPASFANGEFAVQDNGLAGGLTPDAFYFVAAETQPFCNLPAATPPNVVQGNIVVK